MVRQFVRENEELERALDVVGRDNPKYFKPDFAMSSTSFMDQPTSVEELETTAKAPTPNPTTSSDFSAPTPPPFKKARIETADRGPQVAFASYIETERSQVMLQHESYMKYLHAKTEAQNAKKEFYLLKKELLLKKHNACMYM